MSQKYRWILLSLVAGTVVGIVLAAGVPSWDRSTSPAAAGTVGTASGADRPIATLRDFNQAFIEIAEHSKPAVVTVFTERVAHARAASPDDLFGQFFNPRGRRAPESQDREFRQQGLGSGVIVSSDGYILTNNHVVADADSIYVRLLDNRTVPATVVGTDPQTDIAVIRIQEENLPTIEFGDSDALKVGEWVIAVGSPLSANLAHTVTSGIVSAKGRSNVGLADYEDFIQTDAAINPGNSGGALLNLDGKLVGINSAIASRNGGFQGIGFAVPVSMAKRIMDSLIAHGTVVRGWLGVYIQNVDETMAKALTLPSATGVVVSDVVKDGPAAKGGMETGDVVLAMNGKLVKDTIELRNQVADMAPGTKVKLKVMRDSKEKSLTVELGKLGQDAQVASGNTGKAQFGFTVAPFDDDTMRQYDLKRNTPGVVVTDVSSSGPAARSGLRPGDIVTSVNRQRIEGVSDFDRVTAGIAPGETILLRVLRDERSLFVAFTV